MIDVSYDALSITTSGYNQILDITDRIKKFVTDKHLLNGHLLVFINGSTAAISTIEYEPGLIRDLPEMLENIAPADKEYHHDETWHDGNGYAHLRSTLIGCSLTVPVIAGQLKLGTWQQIVLIDFDNRSRKREVILQFVGEHHPL